MANFHRRHFWIDNQKKADSPRNFVVKKATLPNFNKNSGGKVSNTALLVSVVRYVEET